MEVIRAGMGSAAAAGTAPARTRFVLGRELQSLSALISAPPPAWASATRW